jgi:hypothetical protein
VLIFEVTELRLIGWQPLQSVVGALAVLILGLALANVPGAWPSRPTAAPGWKS